MDERSGRFTAGDKQVDKNAHAEWNSKRLVLIIKTAMFCGRHDTPLHGHTDFAELSTCGHTDFAELSTRGHTGFAELSTCGHTDFAELSTRGDTDFAELSTRGHTDFAELSTGGNTDLAELYTQDEQTVNEGRRRSGLTPHTKI
jgi:anthranilate phosphoribosyltransferase